MSVSIDARISKLGIVFPKPSTPAANYVPCVKSGNLVFISGQLPFLDEKLQYVGSVGDELSLDEGYKSARLCGLNILSHLKFACKGKLGCVTKVVKLGGYVNSAADFTEQPKVINGASDLMVQIFDKQIGTHCRFAVSATSLPLGAATEVDGIFEVSI